MDGAYLKLCIAIQFPLFIIRYDPYITYLEGYTEQDIFICIQRCLRTMDN